MYILSKDLIENYIYEYIVHKYIYVIVTKITVISFCNVQLIIVQL